ncbi:polysaccharide biosynthesis protein [Aquihabitans sp. G128]|nr:polysaccharide biosynthesis protein [Aquihabitans sp. G128]QXC61275.1 polysaccharide biosynthesis protein [Aquihabitans sp. G128]
MADSVRATVALLAIPSAGSSLIRDVEERAGRAGLRLLVLPASSELYGAEVGVSDIRPVTPVDLLGRHEHDSDLGAIAGYDNERVLVTGAGRSIGSELCRQIYRFAPASLVMLGDESALHAVQLSIEGRAMLDSRNLVVADIRDHARIQQVFAEHRPEVVFHAAALQAPPPAGDAPQRGAQDQRLGHGGAAAGEPSRGRRALRQHLHRQGRRPDQRAGLHQAPRRAPRPTPRTGWTAPT